MDQITNANVAAPAPRDNDLALILDRIGAIETKVDSLTKATVNNSRDINSIREESVLTPADADDLSNAVRKKGVEVMGGLKSGAYRNRDIRTKVYRDIYYEVKRQYGLINEKGAQLSYKKLRRKYLNGAIETVKEYTLPIELQNDVDAENEVGDLFE